MLFIDLDLDLGFVLLLLVLLVANAHVNVQGQRTRQRQRSCAFKHCCAPSVDDKCSGCLALNKKNPVPGVGRAQGFAGQLQAAGDAWGRRFDEDGDEIEYDRW